MKKSKKEEIMKHVLDTARIWYRFWYWVVIQIRLFCPLSTPNVILTGARPWFRCRSVVDGEHYNKRVGNLTGCLARIPFSIGIATTWGTPQAGRRATR